MGQPAAFTLPCIFDLHPVSCELSLWLHRCQAQLPCNGPSRGRMHPPQDAGRRHSTYHTVMAVVRSLKARNPDGTAPFLPLSECPSTAGRPPTQEEKLPGEASVLDLAWSVHIASWGKHGPPGPDDRTVHEQARSGMPSWKRRQKAKVSLGRNKRRERDSNPRSTKGTRSQVWRRTTGPSRHLINGVYLLSLPFALMEGLLLALPFLPVRRPLPL